MSTDEPTPSERAAAAFHANLEAIVETLPSGVVVVATDGAIVKANAEGLRILGISWDALSERYVAAFETETLYEDGRPCPVEEYPVSRCLASGEPQAPVTIGVRRADGDVAWAVFTATPLRAPAGELLGAIVTFFDISVRRSAEDALRESEQHLRTLFATSPDIIMLVDEEGTVLSVNHTEPPHTPEAVIGLSCFAFLPPEDHAKLRGALRIAFDEGRMAHYETHTAGTDAWYSSRVAPFDTEGTPRTAILIATDISERKAGEEARRRLEARLLFAQKLESLGVLAGGVAHDFRNLLTSIMGRAQLAGRDLPQDSPSHEHLHGVQTTAERAAELTDRLLAYAGKGSLTREPVDLNELTVETSDLLRVSIPDSTAVTLDLQADLPTLEGDATQLRQVVMNLITNAVEAIGPGDGSLTVRTSLLADVERTAEVPYSGEISGRCVCLEVEDDGAGMSKTTLERLFDPFYTTKVAGQGLGLAATLGIVRGHGGAIDVAPRAGGGSIFRVYLPCPRAPLRPQRAAPPPTEPSPPGGLVLVIDDEQHVRVIATLALQQHGYEVLTADSGAEALRVFGERADDVRVVVLDLRMPGMGGEEVLAALKARRADVPIILTSGFGADVAKQHLASGTLAAFLQKPFDLEALTVAVNRAAGGPQ